MIVTDEIAALKSRVLQLERLIGLQPPARVHLPRSLRVKAIQIEIAVAHGFTLNELLSRERTESLAFTRHLAIYICHEVTSASLSALAKLFHRDFSTIGSSHRRIRALITIYPEVAKEVCGWLQAFGKSSVAPEPRETVLPTPQPEIAAAI